MIKLLATIVNVCILLIMLYFLITEGAGGDEWWLVILYFSFITLNLIAINSERSEIKKFFKMPEFISLYFKRIKLEQKFKIKELEEKIK